MTHVLAIDVGGTKLAAGIVSETGEVVVRHQVPTAGDSAAALLATLLRLADSVRSAGADEGAVELSACGVGCGGPMAAGGVHVSPLNIPQWREFPLAARISAHTSLSTWLDNDGKALALAEGWQGAARGCRDYLALVVSTGVGGGLVVDGRLLDGLTGNAGHIGHLIVEPDGHLCACGATGCLEAEASGTAIRAITGRSAKQADAAVIERTGRLVGRAVASVINLLDLEVAAVAGSVALGFGAPFFAAAQDELAARSRIGFARGATIVPAGLGAEDPLIGAAAVAFRQLGVDGLH
jgi:glucokinase